MHQINTKQTFYIGILGVSLFVFSAIIGGFLLEDYSVISQFISESYAIDTEYGMILRAFGYIPSGLLITIFCFRSAKIFSKHKTSKIGFNSLAIFYGIATIVVGIFPCDSGCNTGFIDPSISQIIHNIAGGLTYLLVPLSILLIGIGLKKDTAYGQLSRKGIVLGLISMLFVFVLFSDATSDFRGLYQRIIETSFIIWIISCAIAAKNTTNLISN